jgi:3-deoxy-D-manno-octulosonic acid kinase
MFLLPAAEAAKPVSAAIARGPRWAVLHDPSLVSAPDPGIFERGFWEGRIEGQAGRGRGSVLFVEAGAQHWALRHYCRGGVPGRFLSDQYPWLGEAATRSFREWHMLARLHQAGLPVPRPVAAGWRRNGLLYRADLATLRISGAPLSARVAAGDPVDWRGIGRALQGFHAAGACHADLNAHNILIDESGRAWLLDFDRGRIRPPGSWQQRNLIRLERSLRKIAAEPDAPPFNQETWAMLLAGYREAGDLRLRPKRP